MRGASACLLLIGWASIGRAETVIPDWTGLYIGAHLGNAASDSNWNSITGAPLPSPFGGHFTGGGIVGGIQAGYNQQFGSWVLGIEGEASLADINGGVQCAAAVFSCDAKIGGLGTVSGRIGYVIGDFLFYGKGGAAWLYQTATMTPNPAGPWSDVWQSGRTRSGWMLGAGAEYALSTRVSAKLEYNYLTFGQKNLNFADPSGNMANVGLDQNIHLLKFGLNYKLTGAPLTSSSSVSRDASSSSLWNGIYAGVHTGGGWGTSDWQSASGALLPLSNFRFPGSDTVDGMLAGAQIGFNRQIGSLVAGGEIEATWSNINGFAKCATGSAPPDIWNFTCRSRIDAMGTFAGRLGWAHDDFLVYGKLGAALAKERSVVARDGFPGTFTEDTLRWGYLLGAGLEYAFTPAWSGKIEYNYLDFGTRSASLRDQFGNTSDVDIGLKTHLFKMGLNYKIGVDPSLTSPRGGAGFSLPRSTSDWAAEIGTRYWFSNGSIQKDLYDPDRTSQLNSRLIYSNMNGHAAETFVRFDHRSGLFIKGNFGLGALVNGKLNDEDFPPANNPYSNTQHQVQDSSLRYGNLDIGMNLLKGDAGNIGGYVGYRYFYQRGRGFGCTQIATDTNTCGVPVDTGTVGLTETEQWRGAAFGLNAQFALSDRWKLELDAAYLPYVNHATVDNHWFRPDINPAPAPGHGWGTQVEAILSYAVTERLRLGIGGRYWFFATDQAATRFPLVSNLSPLKYTSERYGGFLQASYQFGGPDRLAPIKDIEVASPTDWTGLYVGGHLGAGFGRSDWSDPFPPPPTGDRVNVGGALGGLQIGVNYQIGQLVVGAELAGSLSRLQGTETCFGGFQPASSAGLNCENTTQHLAMLTGRLGYAVDRNLFYVKAGGALAREGHTLNSNVVPDGEISSRTVSSPGWVIGAGVEHALTGRWSVNAEYKYLDFGSRSVDFTVPTAFSAASSETIRSQRHLLTVGVNYRFGE